MKILILGDQRSKMRFENWENVEYSDDPNPANGPYDYIVLDHLLQQAERTKVLTIAKMYADALVPGGQLAIVVPSLEWACKEVAISDDPNPMAYMSIYGTTEEPNESGMTIIWMRIIMEQIGLTVIRANVEHYKATLNEQVFSAQQNVVIGMKLNIDAANAFVETFSEKPEFTG